MKEGIEWQHVDYFNNKVICDLVEEQHKGILAILDEACLNVGKVTDEVLQFFRFSLFIRQLSFNEMSHVMRKAVFGVSIQVL